MSTDAEMIEAVSKIRATYDAGHWTLEEALEQAYRYGRISGLQAGIDSLQAIFPPAPDSRKVQA